MADRPSQTTRAGLNANLTQTRHGDWAIALTDDQGTEVWSKSGYSSEASAKASASYWVQKHYQVETQEAPADPEPTDKRSKYRNLGPTPATLAPLMRARADDNEEKAIALRAQAGDLEIEAKRLREAADTLEGPDGQT